MLCIDVFFKKLVKKVASEAKLYPCDFYEILRTLVLLWYRDVLIVLDSIWNGFTQKQDLSPTLNLVEHD